jgi:hypothetical protein
VSAAPRKVKVFLSGEGSSELGSRSGHPSYQNDERPGVLQALLARVQGPGWEVGRACDWRSIRKYRFARAEHEDTLNVLGAALDAKEWECDVLAFSRDVDKDHARKDAIEEGIKRVPQTLANAPQVIGGAAVPTLEGWILALLETRGTETLTPKRAEETLAGKGVLPKNGPAMAGVVEAADLAKIPPDATSLRAWLRRAEGVLPPLVAIRATIPTS